MKHIKTYEQNNINPIIAYHDNGQKRLESYSLNDKLHREGGPAIEYANGDKEWYINDKHYTEAEYNDYMMVRNFESL